MGTVITNCQAQRQVVQPRTATSVTGKQVGVYHSGACVLLLRPTLESSWLAQERVGVSNRIRATRPLGDPSAEPGLPAALPVMSSIPGNLHCKLGQESPIGWNCTARSSPARPESNGKAFPSPGLATFPAQGWLCISWFGVNPAAGEARVSMGRGIHRLSQAIDQDWPSRRKERIETGNPTTFRQVRITKFHSLNSQGAAAPGHLRHSALGPYGLNLVHDWRQPRRGLRQDMISR